jgi:hypothetical protein
MVTSSTLSNKRATILRKPNRNPLSRYDVREHSEAKPLRHWQKTGASNQCLMLLSHIYESGTAASAGTVTLLFQIRHNNYRSYASARKQEE